MICHDGAGLGPNEKLVGLRDSRRALATPCLIVDRGAMERNLAAAQDAARTAGLSLWPHAKSHKCSRLAKLQLERGARRICVANLHEAEVFAAAGVRPLLITSPVVGADKIARLVALAEDCPDLMIVVDHDDNARQIAEAARQQSTMLNVLIDVDVGMGRTGAASLPDIVALTRLILADGSLRLKGVQGYSGRVQHIHDYAERASLYGRQLETLAAAAAALVELGVAQPVVTGGGTGTLAIDARLGIVREQQAGSYVFMDAQYLPVVLTPDARPLFETSLSLRASVVSANRPGQATLDAGIKALATDGPKPWPLSREGHGATYEFFGDEHGRLVLTGQDARLDVGCGIELITPHCDPTVNLHDVIHVVEGDRLVDIWRIDARGSL